MRTAAHAFAFAFALALALLGAVSVSALARPQPSFLESRAGAAIGRRQHERISVSTGIGGARGRRMPFPLPLASSSSSPAMSEARTIQAGEQEVLIKKVDTDEEVMEVASYRNNLESPQMLIERQASKRAALDTTADAIKGVVTGYGIGAVLGALNYSNGGNVQEAATQAAVFGTVFAALLGANNYMGKSVYVMNIDEAKNRLKVDFAEGLMARQDVGFVAKVEDVDLYGGRYRGSNGVVGCVDCQLRNCPESRNAREYGTLPPHVHIRNVDVDRGMRRRGIATALVQAVEDYARTTPAQMITLVVDNTNFGAIDLYKKFGYDMEDIGNPMAQSKYGVWTRGRSIMTKYI